MSLNLCMLILGGSLLPQTLRSDFDQILIAIKEHAATHENQTTPGLSDFVQALVFIVSGNFSAAENVVLALQASIAAGRLTGVWSVRLAILKSLGACYQLFPPVLGYWKGLEGVTPLLDDASGRLKQIQMAMFDSTAPYQEHFTEQDWFEFRTVNMFLQMPFRIWNHAIIFHRGSPDVFLARSAFVEDAKESLSQGMTVRTALRTLAQRLEEPGLKLDLELLDLQTELASDSDTWRDLHMAMRSSALSRNDYATLGLLDMMLADKLVSPAFTSPLALNLIALESHDVDPSNPQWDPVERTLRLNSSSHVDELYRAALEAFKRSNTIRGCGAVMMRQACLTYGVHCDDDNIPAAGVLESAREKFQDAAKFLTADFTQTQLVHCHLVILDILQGDTGSALRRAEVIGQACIDAQNSSLGRFIGVLFLRFGRRQLSFHSRLDIALRSYRCAEACFSKLAALALILKALVAQSEAYSDMLNYGAALDLLQRHRPLFWTLMHDLDKKQKSDGNEDGVFISLQINLLTTYSTKVSLTYLRANHPAQMRQWDEEVKDWLSRPEIVAHRKHVFSQKEVTDFALAHIPEGERSDVWSNTDIESMWLRRYTVALNRHQRARNAMDMDKAESEMQRFIEYVSGDSACVTALRLGVIACNDIGNTEGAQNFLRLIPFAKLFNRAVRSLYHGPELWVRPVDTRYFVEPSGVDVALHLCIMANDWDLGRRVSIEIRSLNPTYLQPPEKIVDRDVAYRLTYAAVVCMNTGNDQDAFSLLLEVVRYLETGRGLTVDPDSRRGSRSNVIMAAIPVLAATLCERSSHKNPTLPDFCDIFPTDSRPGTWLEAAILFEEQGKARQLRDLLDQTGTTLELNTNQGHGDRDLLIQLRRLPPSERTAEENEEIEVLDATIKTTNAPLSIAQELPSYEPSSLRLNELYPIIPTRVLILSMSFSRYASILFALDHSGVRRATQIELNDIAMQKLAVRIINMTSSSDDARRDENRLKLDEQIDELSSHILAPVHDLIDDSSHIMFVPGQPLTNFPFQILHHRGVALFLSKSVSLVPSLATLQNLLGRQRNIDPVVSAICKPSTPAEHIRTDEALIPMASIEAISISRLFASWPQASSTVDRETFKTTLKNSAVVHVGVHGRRHAISPWLAHLSLKERLYVLDFAYMHNTAALIVFSACLSGRGYATLGNDELGFATAVLASGCQCYVGALWEIDDVATLLLMTAFYKHMASTPGLTVAEMLRLAQCEVYHMTRSTAIERLQEIEGFIDEASQAGEKLDNLIRKPKMLLRKQIQHLPESFSHPFYWASFMPVGNALIQMRQASEEHA